MSGPFKMRGWSPFTQKPEGEKYHTYKTDFYDKDGNKLSKKNKPAEENTSSEKTDSTGRKYVEILEDAVSGKKGTKVYINPK